MNMNTGSRVGFPFLFYVESIYYLFCTTYVVHNTCFVSNVIFALINVDLPFEL